LVIFISLTDWNEAGAMVEVSVVAMIVVLGVCRIVFLDVRLVQPEVEPLAQSAGGCVSLIDGVVENVVCSVPDPDVLGMLRETEPLHQLCNGAFGRVSH
jgi:hypothetical protein